MIRHASLLFLGMLAAASTLPVSAQTAELLLDINQTPVAKDGSVQGLFDLDGFGQVRDQHLGIAKAADSTFQLFAMDPVARTATQLTRFPPPEAYVETGIRSTVVANLDGRPKLWFARAGTIWQSDGTTAGTTPVLELGSIRAMDDAGYARLLVWTANSLWVFNGTSANRLASWSTPISTDIPRATNPRDVSYFIENSRTLWRTDGTPAGTRIVVSKPNSWLYSLASHDGRVLLTASGPNGRELWQSNGTAAGTAELRDINPGPSGSAPRVAVGASLGAYYYFAATTAQRGQELWRTDGTKAGTTLAADLWPNGSSGVERLTAIGNALWFAALTGAQSDTFVYDGSSANPLGVMAAGQGFTALGAGRVAFSIKRNDLRVQRELYISDGSSTGTRRIDVRPGNFESVPTALTELSNGRVAFSAIGPRGDREYWVSDGSPAGTNLHIDIRPGFNTAGSHPSIAPSSAPDGTSHYFSARANGAQASQLYRRNNRQLTDLGAVTLASGGMHELVRNGQRLLVFGGSTPTTGIEPWVTDNTRSGTRPLANLVAGQASSRPTSWTTLGNRVVFAAFQPATGVELWTTDGTPSGTKMLPEIRPGSTSSEPNGMTIYHGRGVFLATDSNGIRSLWATDGTATGTRRWIARAPVHRNGPRQLTLHNGLFYYFADANLWSTDGTAANTKALSSTALPGEPKSAVWTSTALYFVFETARADELWMYDSTAKRVDSFARRSIKELTPIGSRLAFVASKPSDGARLWLAKGNSTQAIEVVPGSDEAPYPFDLLAAGEGFYFGALDDRPGVRAGHELFYATVDPVAARRVADIRPGPSSGFHGGLQFIGDDLVFVGDTEAFGKELYRLRDVRAHIVPVGGCAISRMSLRATAPVLGQVAILSGRAGPGVAPQIVFLGLPTIQPVVLPESPCPLRFSIHGPILPLAAPFTPTWQTGLPIPNDPSLSQRSVVVQTLGQLGSLLVTSNGARLVIGH